MLIRDPLTAPGVPDTRSEREQAIEFARMVVTGRQCLTSLEQELLAREYLRALGLPA